MDALPPTMRSSLLIDLSAGKRTEVEALQGAVVRRAQAAGVPVPIMSALYAVLKPHARSGYVDVDVMPARAATMEGATTLRRPSGGQGRAS